MFPIGMVIVDKENRPNEAIQLDVNTQKEKENYIIRHIMND